MLFPFRIVHSEDIESSFFNVNIADFCVLPSGTVFTLKYIRWGFGSAIICILQVCKGLNQTESRIYSSVFCSETINDSPLPIK